MIWIILKMMLTSGLSIKRWNSYPRIEDISHLDNVWFIVHIALFMAYLEEKNWKTIDKQFLVKRIIFSSLKTLVLSDISSETRVYVKKINPTIQQQLEQKSYDFILSFEAPKNIKKDMESILSNTKNTYELEMISAAKKYASYRECLINMKIYNDVYDKAFAGINNYFEEKRKEIYSLDLILRDKNYEKYLSKIRSLSHNQRWNKQKRIFPISVMSHLVITTFLAYVISMLENNNWWKYDVYDCVITALYHDIAESITWDIITPTKKAVSWFEEVLWEVEKNMIEESLFCYIPKDFEKQIGKYILDPWNWRIWKLVKVWDILSALLESKIEVDYGSTNFIDMYDDILLQLKKKDYKSLDYILSDIMRDFDNFSDDIDLRNV